jgi:hypothetical protein
VAEHGVPARRDPHRAEPVRKITETGDLDARDVLEAVVVEVAADAIGRTADLPEATPTDSWPSLGRRCGEMNDPREDHTGERATRHGLVLPNTGS